MQIQLIFAFVFIHALLSLTLKQSNAAYTDFVSKKGFCSNNPSFASKSDVTKLECLMFCQHQSKCISVDWRYTRQTLGTCDLQDNRFSLSVLFDNQECIHYEKEEMHADCQSWYNVGARTNRLYQVVLSSLVAAVQVYCVMNEKERKGWTVFHRRFDGSVDFNQGWNAYKQGFGRVAGEHWLGFNLMLALMKVRDSNELKINVETFSGIKGTARYSEFALHGDAYKLFTSGYIGDIGDGLKAHNHVAFSAYDMENDVHATFNCAKEYAGGWWYKSCFLSNLNGKYHAQETVDLNSMVWWDFPHRYTSLKKAEMMFC